MVISHLCYIRSSFNENIWNIWLFLIEPYCSMIYTSTHIKNILYDNKWINIGLSHVSTDVRALISLTNIWYKLVLWHQKDNYGKAYFVFLWYQIIQNLQKICFYLFRNYVYHSVLKSSRNPLCKICIISSICFCKIRRRFSWGRKLPPPT